MKLLVILCGLIFVIVVSAQRRASPSVTSSETPVVKSHTSRGRAKFSKSPEFAEIADTVADEESSRNVQPARRRLDYERHTETRHRPQETSRKLSGHGSYEVEEVIDDIPRENIKRPLLRNRNTLEVSSTPVVELSTAKLEISSETSEISSEAAITPESTSEEVKSEASLPTLFTPETSEATLEVKKQPKLQKPEPSPIVELVREEPRRVLTRTPLKSRANLRVETTTHAARIPSRTRPPRKEVTETTTHQAEITRTRNFRRRPADSVAHESTNRRSFSIESENEHPTRSRTGRKIESKITKRIDIDVDEPNSRVRRTGIQTASSRRREARIAVDTQVSEIGTQEKVHRRVPQKSRARSFEVSTEALNDAPKAVRRNSRLRSMPPFDEAKLEVLPLFESEPKTEKSTAVDVAPELSKTTIESTSPLTTPKQVTGSTTTEVHEATTFVPKVRSKPRKNEEPSNIETSSPKARTASRFTTEHNFEASSPVPKVRSTRFPVKATKTTHFPVNVDTTTTTKPKFRNALNRRAPIRELKNNKLDTEPKRRNHHSTTSSEATPPRSRNQRKEGKRFQESTTSRNRNRHASETSSTTESPRRTPKQERSQPKKIEPTISETRLQNLAPRRSRVQRPTTGKPEEKSEAPVKVPNVETEVFQKTSNVEVKQEAPLQNSKPEVNHEAPIRAKSEMKVETPLRQKAEVKIEAPLKHKAEIKVETPLRQKAEIKVETPLRQKAEVKVETPVRSFKSEVRHEAPARSLRRGVSRFNKMEDELHSQEVAESTMSKSVKRADTSETILKRSRNTKRGTTKNHSDLTSSEEQIEESDNYPESFKALINAKKEKETRSKEDVIVVTPEKIVSSSAALKLPYPPSQRDQRKDEDNNIQVLNSSPHAPRRSAPRTTTRVEISESTSDNKIETALKPTALPPSTSTMKEVLTSITSKITRQRFHARFKADVAKSEKSKPNYANSTTAERNRTHRAKPRNLQTPKAATGLYSSKKGTRSTTATPKVETTTHKRSYPARNNVVEHYVATSEASISKSKPHRFSSKYRSDILRATGFNKATPAPAYVPTVPTVTPVISTTSTTTQPGVITEENELGMEIISLDEPVRVSIPSANLIRDEYLQSTPDDKTNTTPNPTKTNKNKLTMTSDQVSRPVNLLESILHAITSTTSPIVSSTNNPLRSSTMFSTSSIRENTIQQLTTENSNSLFQQIIQSLTQNSSTTTTTTTAKPTTTPKPRVPQTIQKIPARKGDISFGTPRSVIDRILNSLSSIQSIIETTTSPSSTERVDDQNAVPATEMPIVTTIPTLYEFINGNSGLNNVESTPGKIYKTLEIDPLTNQVKTDKPLSAGNAVFRWKPVTASAITEVSNRINVDPNELSSSTTPSTTTSSPTKMPAMQRVTTLHNIVGTMLANLMAASTQAPTSVPPIIAQASTVSSIIKASPSTTTEKITTQAPITTTTTEVPTTTQQTTTYTTTEAPTTTTPRPTTTPKPTTTTPKPTTTTPKPTTTTPKPTTTTPKPTTTTPKPTTTTPKPTTTTPKPTTTQPPTTTTPLPTTQAPRTRPPTTHRPTTAEPPTTQVPVIRQRNRTTQPTTAQPTTSQPRRTSRRRPTTIQTTTFIPTTPSTTTTTTAEPERITIQPFIVTPEPTIQISSSTARTISSTLKTLTEEQKKNIETLAELEKEQAAILKQLSFLTNLIPGGGGGRLGKALTTARPTRANSPFKNVILQTPTKSNDLQALNLLQALTKTTAKPDPQQAQLEQLLKQYNIQPSKFQTTTPQIQTSKLLETLVSSTTQKVDVVTVSAQQAQLEKLLKQYNIQELNTQTTPASISLPYGTSSDAVLAAILKQRGIGPSTPKLQFINQLQPERTTQQPAPTTERPGMIRQGLNWLLNAMAPVQPQRAPVLQRARPQYPAVETNTEEILTRQPTRLTPVIYDGLDPVTNSIPSSTIKPRAAVPDFDETEATYLLKQIQAIQKDPVAAQNIVAQFTGKHSATYIPGRRGELSPQELVILLKEVQALQRDPNAVRNIKAVISESTTTRRTTTTTTTTTTRRPRTTTKKTVGDLSEAELAILLKQIQALQQNPQLVQNLDVSQLVGAATRNTASYADVDDYDEGPTRKATRSPRVQAQYTPQLIHFDEEKPITKKTPLPPVAFRPVNGIPSGDGELTGRLVNAAVSVTKAISSFLGSALKGATSAISTLVNTSSRNIGTVSAS